MKYGIALLVVFLTIFSPCIAQKKSDLKLRLKVGDSYDFKSNSVVTTSTTTEGKTEDSFILFIQHLKFRVSGFKKGVFDIEVKYDTFQILTVSPRSSFGATSEQTCTTTNNAVSHALNKAKGQPFQILLTENGEILEVNGHSQIWEKAVVLPADAPAYGSAIREIFSDKVLRSDMERIFSFYPGEKVAEGDGWKKPVTIGSNFFGFSTRMSYKLVERTKDYSRIEGHGLIILRDKEMDFHDLKMDLQKDVSIVFNMSGTISFTVIIDNKTGWITYAENINKAKGKMTAGKHEFQLDISGQSDVNKRGKPK